MPKKPVKRTIDKGNLGKIEVWEIDGVIHRDDGPAEINYFQKTKGGQWLKRSETWYLKGIIHKIEKPAFIEYFEDGKTLRAESWYNNGKLHRELEPAVVRYWKDEKIYIEKWYIEGKLGHLFNGPSLKAYNRYGTLISHCWYDKDVASNFEGPAEISFHKNGSRRKWIFNGVPTTSKKIRDLLGIKGKIPNKFTEEQTKLLKVHFGNV